LGSEVNKGFRTSYMNPGEYVKREPSRVIGVLGVTKLLLSS